MTVLETEDFEGVPVSTELSTGNSSFDSIIGSLIVGSASSIHGDRAAAYSGTAQAAGVWTFSARDFLYVSGYMRIDNLGSGNHSFVRVRLGTGGNQVSECRFRSSQGDFQIRNFQNTAVATSSLSVSNGDVVRWEWLVDRGNTTQTLRLFTGVNLEGSTPDDSITGSTGAGDSTFTECQIGGKIIAGAGTTGVTMDSVRIGDDTDAWGPWPSSAEPAEATAEIPLSLALGAESVAVHRAEADIPLAWNLAPESATSHNVATEVLLPLEISPTTTAPVVDEANVAAEIPLSLMVAAETETGHNATAAIPLTVAIGAETDAPVIGAAEATTEIPLTLDLGTTTQAVHSVISELPLELLISATATISGPGLIEVTVLAGSMGGTGIQIGPLTGSQISIKPFGPGRLQAGAIVGLRQFGLSAMGPARATIGEMGPARISAGDIQDRVMVGELRERGT